jgi:hypothetical protein
MVHFEQLALDVGLTWFHAVGPQNRVDSRVIYKKAQIAMRQGCGLNGDLDAANEERFLAPCS